MTFYQRFGMFVGLGGVAIVAAGWEWIGFGAILVCLLLLVFDGDRPGEVTSKWYGIVPGGLVGPFMRANEVNAGCYGIKPDGVIQIFGTGGWAEKVGIVLHPAPDHVVEYAEDEQGNLYKVSTEPFDPES